MKKKSEVMGALKELTEKRLLTSEVEALFEPYKDFVFPLSLSFVSSERSFGSQKDTNYNEGYKVLCIAENWSIGIALLFAPEDNDLVEAFDPSQKFEANVRFIDYDSLYQRAIFGKLGAEEESPEEESPEEESPEEEDVVPPPIAETAIPSIEETTSVLKDESIVPDKKITAPESELEVPELVTKEPQQSADETGEVWGWDPGNEEGQEITAAQEVLDPEPEQSVFDPVQLSVPSPSESRYVYTEEESQLWKDDDEETDQFDQESAQSTGCSKGCMGKVSATFYVVGGLNMLGGCTADGGGGVMFVGLILIGIGYATQKATPKG
jgi:hypothetical protein